jgi:hypothetical protein
MQQHLTDPDPTQGAGGIDSVQNGLLLGIQLHYFWDNFGVSMYPLHTDPVFRSSIFSNSSLPIG